ncbi:hypothetical protein DUNSADRAFT_2018 [Dunaliella salina]|uniref:Uncharacterized protein n=1 Tax=Dunaliella salina TaxID=3046 RepID=A0ABQ7FWR3_DUNSA|nr:hypothetical protein DUNSADRAFT_2018 [Dunaliella salina]|eukprot:KAF5826799.1 hypothetical protein DUNSADRAFT_2018 [Dunaliella salina]
MTESRATGCVTCTWAGCLQDCFCWPSCATCFCRARHSCIECPMCPGIGHAGSTCTALDARSCCVAGDALAVEGPSCPKRASYLLYVLENLTAASSEQLPCMCRASS